MDSWTLQGDSYSFLHSAPCTPYSLIHRDGSPNHVEIFDIISSPIQRGAISETTCLCDIFGDDCESPSLSSSPAVGAIVHSQTEAEGTTVASPPLDDLNESSGSYHTAPCSSEGEEGLDDQVDTIHSPLLQGESGKPTIECSELSKDNSSSFESKDKSLLPQISSEVDTIFGERTLSPGHNSSSISSLSSSSAETRCSRSVNHQEQGRLTPRNNNPSHQSLTQSPSLASMNCNIASSLESVNIQSEVREAGVSPGPTPTDCSSQSSNVDSTSNLPFDFPSPGCTEGQSEDSLQLNNTPSSLNTPSSSPFPELGGRVPLPDLMSRGSTPDIQIQNSIQNSELLQYLTKESTIPLENLDAGLHAEFAIGSRPAPRYKPPSPGISFIPSHVESGGLPELKHTSPSPDRLGAPSMNKSWSRTSSPGSSRSKSASSEIITAACSPVISYSLSPSPGIRSTCSSIESTHTAPSPEIRITASSPEVKRRECMSEEHSTPDSLLLESSRSNTSSPHITGNSYSDGDTSLFPELRRLSTPEPGRTDVSPDRQSPASNRVSTPRDSSPVSDFSSAEITQPRSQTSSPQSIHQTPSPELRYQSQDSSPDHRSRDQSPPTVSPDHRYNHCSPSTLLAEYNSQYLLPTPRLNAPVQVISSSPDIANTQDHIELEKERVQPSSDFHKVEKTSTTKSSSPVELFQSPVTNSPFLTKDRLNKSRIHHRPKDRLQQKVSLYRENQEPQRISHFNGPTNDNKYVPRDLLFNSKDRPSKSLQREEKRLNQHIRNLLKSENKKSHCASDHSRQKLGDRARHSQDMAQHLHRRKTPSPPLTRFTPIHIIAPEKPHRQWQSRGHSDSAASSENGYLKKAVTNRESPNDNNSKSHIVTQAKQLEREKRMQLEEERERRLRGIEREKGRVGWEEWHKDASYRGEQVELSFNAKNRNGPTSRSTAPTSRESRQGLPTVHSYSESLPATTEPQEQKSLLKLASQQDKGGCPTGRLQPSAPQNKISARSVTNRPGRSSSSSMGSELDEADNEVKWLTDVAFRSLSSPEVDYLDMYNSSHRSSTNISQPSTQESPAGVSGVWPTYADFRGSASKLENDEYFLQQQPLYHSDGMGPSHPYEMGSFECIDVAVEREESKKMKRGVPKRQIQLKKKESKDDSSENKSPGMLAMENSTLLERHSGEVFLRQYSTPAEVQECYTPELCHEPEHNERKNKLQKSVSLDETSSKTKMATCLIKSILSKKMQGADNQPDEPNEEEVNTTEGDPDSILYSNPSKDIAVKGEQIQRDDMRPVKSNGDQFNMQSSISSNRIGNFSHTNHKQSSSKDRNTTALPSEIRSQLRVPLDSWQSKNGVQPIDERKTWQESDSTNANTGDPSVTRAYSTPTMMTSLQQECEHIEGHKQVQQGESRHTPKGTQEAKLKNVEKKKASLNVCLTPEAEKNLDASPPDFRQLEEKVNVDFKIEDDRNENNKVKGPIHKVRDVRRLVKNTYNLSFKATMSVSPSDINEEKIVHLNEINEDRINEDVSENVQGKTEEMREETNKCTVKMGEKQKVEVKDKKLPMQSEEKSQSQLHPMQIECKAVCWREGKNNIVQSHKDSGGKILASEGEQTCNSDIQQGMQEPSSKGRTAKSWQQTSNMEAETQKETASEVVMRSDKKPPMLVSLPKLTSKEREVSTAVVLIRDASRQEKTSAPPTQEDVHICPQAQAATPSPEVTATGSAPSASSHSVSMLLKEKGYQADIGAVMGDSQNSAGGKKVPRKHVNCLEIPFQTPSDVQNEPHREKTLSSSATMSSPSFSCDHADKPTKATEDEVGPTKHKNTIPQGPPQDYMQTPNKQKETEDFEGVKRQDSTFPPRSPVVRRFRPQPIEVKSLSKETITKQEITTNSPKNNRSQTIEFKSIAKNTDKPIVPPKPTCKFKPADFGVKTNEVPFNMKPQSEERSRTIVVSSPTIYRKIPTEASSTSNQTRKLAVSTVSSLKPPPSKITTASISSLANQSATEASRDRDEQQSLQASPARSVHATTATSAPAPSVTSTESDAVENQVPELPHASQPANTHEATLSTTSSHPKPPVAVSTTGYIQQQYCRSLSSERAQRTTDLHFYASDDPPSYDERESFSPLLPDFTPRRSNRYQNPSHPPPCSCTAGCPPPPQPALPPLPAPPHHHPHHHHHHSPHNLTPPPPHSPGHVIPHHAPLRTHQYRADPQPVIFQPSSSPKSSPLGPNHPPAIYQPLHQPPTCPPNPSIMPVERPMPIEPRRLPLHRSPQQQPPGMPGAPYSDHGHSHSPGLGPIDPQYLYGSEYGGDSSSLYSESHFGQTPRRVLLDPETGKYFYIEVPMQPLRKMLFDPETGQYVEVLIPQQAMSHSGVYPSPAAPYSSLHNPNMYGPAPQYMPYAAHPPPAHPHPQPPRYPEVSASATMHPNGPSGSYRSCSGQGSKPEPQSHPSLDQSYLDGMYYVPTGMNASANTTPSVYHHKHPSSLPPSGGKRS